MASTAIPAVQRIPREDVKGIIRAIAEDGACIIKGFTDPALVQKVNEETRSYLDDDKPWKGDLFPPETRRCTNLCGRSETAREVWLRDDLIRTINAKFVDKTTSNYYGETKHTYTSEAYCHIALTMEIGPGGKAQRLHRDNKNWHAEHVDQTKTGYRFGSDSTIGFMIPGVPTRRESAATQVIPGSHLWDQERPPKIEEVTWVEMDVGDCSVHLGSTYHAGGENTTKDVQRTMHALFFARGYLRQEENIYLANSKEDVLRWSPEAQKLLGYSLSSPNLGFVYFRTPMQYLEAGESGGVGDFDPSQEKKRDSGVGSSQCVVAGEES